MQAAACWGFDKYPGCWSQCEGKGTHAGGCVLGKVDSFVMSGEIPTHPLCLGWENTGHLALPYSRHKSCFCFHSFWCAQEPKAGWISSLLQLPSDFFKLHTFYSFATCRKHLENRSLSRAHQHGNISWSTKINSPAFFHPPKRMGKILI